MVHMKTYAWPIVATLALTLCIVPTPARAASLLLVLNKGDRTLVIVDGDTLRVKGRVPAGPDPHEVIASADGRTAYISNYTQGNGAPNTLTPVDLVGMKALPPIDLGALSRPHGLTLGGGKVYFTAERSKMIGSYDPAPGKVDWVMGTGQNLTHMVIVSKDRRRIFTTNLGSATVCILEQAGADWNLTTIPVGRRAEGFDLSPDESELWVANAQDASISIIDLGSGKVVKTLSVPFQNANRLKFTPDGKYALVSDPGGKDLFVLDVASRTLVTTIDVGGNAAGIQMEPNGARAFVAVGAANSVAVIDLKDLKIIRRLATGPAPDGLAWAELK